MNMLLISSLVIIYAGLVAGAGTYWLGLQVLDRAHRLGRVPALGLLVGLLAALVAFLTLLGMMIKQLLTLS